LFFIFTPKSKIQNLKSCFPYALCPLRYAIIALIFALCALPLPAASAATVTLAWDKNPEPNLAGYKVHYGTSTGNYDYSVDVGNYTSCTISGLQEGTTYYFAATAYDSNNFESNLSEELAYMIPAGVSGAGAIVNAAKNVIEAEQMSNHTNGTQTGDYWLLWSNGAMSQDVDFPNAGTYSFEITAKGDLANSVGPEMEFTVFVNTNIPEVYIFEVEVSAGTHEVAIAFNNDYYDTAQGADRNLYVDKIAIVPSPNYLTTDVIEAEQMGYHANGAQTGDYWLLWSNGTMDEDVGFLNTGTYHFEITAKGDLADGVGAEMQLLIDGQSKGIVFVNTNTPEIFKFEAEVSAGTHEVAIAFNNDYYDSAKDLDRNLYVDKINILSSTGYVTTTVIEAEQMSYHANGAQDGAFWLLWANGTMNEDVSFPNSGTYRIEITAKGDLANGVGPEMQMLIDGQSQGIVFVNTNTPDIYIFEVEVSAGTHELIIAFNNDYYDPVQGVDRNLYVDKIAISYPLQ
jgi:hypothetical protein